MHLPEDDREQIPVSVRRKNEPMTIQRSFDMAIADLDIRGNPVNESRSFAFQYEICACTASVKVLENLLFQPRMMRGKRSSNHVLLARNAVLQIAVEISKLDRSWYGALLNRKD